MKLWKRLITFWIVQKYQYNSSGYPKFLWIFLYFRKEIINKMKLGKYGKLKKHGKSKKQVVAYDIETTYDNSLLPTVTVSFKDVTSEPNPSEKLSKPIRPRSSLTQTAAPCDICHCKAKRLFSLSQQGLIYFVCHKCYKEVCANRGKFTKNIVDLSNLVRNSQHSVKWEVLGTDNKKLTSRLNKRKRQNKKNKGV